MNSQTEKIHIHIALHQKDYEAMKAAAEILKLAPDEYCKLAIHKQNVKTLRRE
ncbi:MULTISPECIES: hypothetical protein [Pseudomonas]|uniref:Uncharacterized protein n=1 Tax=Pseudomonas rubra TaxID=2942627 RepID=A0ABT5P5R1_9PSED|nr:hypothetical protein [Pseudomonas rubra]MDD1013631.1 hypothetical protein [Pseudomonas rubra]MDD1040050.1 hypothetical protein [Pseudomonas rubra]MDD1155944.1 hypothetical protein [Pseudomonas rubra]